MTELDWTKHAQDVLKERCILINHVNNTVNNPDLIINDKHDSDLIHHLKSIPEFGDRVLRVIINHTAKPN